MPVKLRRIGSSYDAYADGTKVGEVYRTRSESASMVAPAGLTNRQRGRRPTLRRTRPWSPTR